jgi:two-component system osmolarity sensor histidine kinase EnvZ
MATSLAHSERERTVMLAGISHDLRTPLTKLRLGVEILSAQSEPALVASMTRSIDEMDAIVGQFLDHARGDAGSESPQPFPLDALAREVAAARADHGQPLTLALGATPALPLRVELLRRALINLVENAFKHGRGPVALSTGSDAGNVWAEVADQGDGISATDVERLRQPFQRAQTARNGPPGAGLGLAIAERAVRAHGGELRLLKNEPCGLRARLVLPRR